MVCDLEQKSHFDSRLSYRNLEGTVYITVVHIVFIYGPAEIMHLHDDSTNIQLH